MLGKILLCRVRHKIIGVRNGPPLVVKPLVVRLFFQGSQHSVLNFSWEIIEIRGSYKIRQVRNPFRMPVVANHTIEQFGLSGLEFLDRLFGLLMEKTIRFNRRASVQSPPLIEGCLKVTDF